MRLKLLRNVFLASFTIILPFITFAQVRQPFNINIHLTGLVNGGKAYLKLINDDLSAASTDSALIAGDRLSFHGIVGDGPRYFELDIPVQDSISGSFSVIRLVVNDGDNIEISCDSNVSKIHHSFIENYLHISGSPSNMTWQYIMAPEFMYFQTMLKFNSEINKIGDSLGFVPALIDPIMENKKKLNESFEFLINSVGKDILYPPAIPFALKAISLQNVSERSPILMSIFQRLDHASQQNFYGRQLRDFALCSVGQTFPGFSLPDPQGKIIELRDIVSKGKMTIVQFWAENSYERAKYQDELKQVFRKYHASGLNVIGVSSDKYADIWKDALRNYQLPWYQVSESKGRDGIVETVYHEYSTDIGNNYMIHNTTNVLIDDQGKIIAWDPTPVELKYYLWKTFGK